MRNYFESQEKITFRGVDVSYRFVRSSRKSLSVRISDGQMTVHAPYFFRAADAEPFLVSRQNWILQKLQESRKKSDPENTPSSVQLTDSQKKALEERYRALARDYISQRTAFYASRTGGHYSSISIRSQKTRWGSCSSRGTLSFNWRLILAPPVILDYVVVHELCHLQHMNHSADFWNAVAEVMPDYRIRRKWLKVHGNELAASYEPVPYSNV